MAPSRHNAESGPGRTPPAETSSCPAHASAIAHAPLDGSLDRQRLLNAARDHAVLAAALDPIITIDAYGVIQSASDSVRRVFGWTPEELVGRNVNVLMPEPHRSGHDEYLSNYRRTGKTNILGQAREFEAVRKNGDRFPIELSVSRVEVPGVHKPMFVGIIRDVSEQKRLESELRLIQSLALSISVASNVHGAFVETIRQIALATGWEYGELWTVTRTGDALEPAAHWNRPARELDEFAKSMRSCVFEMGVGLPGRAWATKSPVWIDDLSTLGPSEFCRPNEAMRAELNAATAIPILSEQAPIAVLVLYVRRKHVEVQQRLELVRAAVAPLGPLIHRKQAEEALEDHRRRLEVMVHERTRELLSSQEQLQMADRLASIGTLAAGLGHDMNNVLLPVRARLNALRAAWERGAIPDDAHAHVEAVRKSVSYLQQLADGLHYLVMDPDTDDSVGESTELHAWWESAGALISKAVPKHVRVVGAFDPVLPAVAVPAHRLTQAVLNLVVNAGEAIPGPKERKRKQGLVRVWAERSSDDSGPERVRIVVSDNGLGMTDDVRRRAFEMFFTTKSRGMGTGLGLPLVHKVVDRAGGDVRIESERGKGTTVIMTFPAAHTPIVAPDAEPKIALSMRDGRAADALRRLCESAGGAVVAADAPGDAGVWVVDPRSVDIALVRRWREKNPRGRLILFGTIDGANAEPWSRLNEDIIVNDGEYETVRTVANLAIGALTRNHA